MNVKSWKKSSVKDESGNKFTEFTFTTDLDFDPDILVGYLFEFPRHINNVKDAKEARLLGIRNYWSKYTCPSDIYSELTRLLDSGYGTINGIPVTEFIEYGEHLLYSDFGVVFDPD